MLRNGENPLLTAGQIAAHLHTKDWNVTRELQLGLRERQAGRRTQRLHGDKVLGEGVGAGGQWRVNRDTYLAWLQIPAEDRGHLGPDGLPELIPFGAAAQAVDIDLDLFRTMMRQQRWPHIAFGRNRYLTHNQLERLRVLLDKDCRDLSR